MPTLEPHWRAALRNLILHRLRVHGPQTTHELATGCQVSVEAVMPRMSELEASGDVFDTGRRKSSVSGRGRKQKVWRSADNPVGDPGKADRNVGATDAPEWFKRYGQ